LEDPGAAEGVPEENFDRFIVSNFMGLFPIHEINKPKYYPKFKQKMELVAQKTFTSNLV
jgi:hypothetical protein